MAEVADGSVVDARYSVRGRIGSGGMADVYLADDEHLGRQVALKVLHRRFARDQQFVERFRREASAAAGLQHPNVVSVYDRGEHDGTYYIAMENLPGRTLRELLRQEAPLSQERAINFGIQILNAAGFAHKRGVVHRDFKPHNVIVAVDDSLKVTDFGIARAGASEMTETGSIMGTAQYLSPEQAQGKPVDHRSDLYSIGIMLYEMLAGRVPFTGDSAVAIALKHVNDVPHEVGREAPQAAAQLVNVGLRPEIVRVKSFRPIGIVVSQDPTAGKTVEKSSTVKLRVSNGPGLTSVPDVTGKPLDQAIKILKKQGLFANTSFEHSSDVSRGLVISTTAGATTQVP